jgi:hypothetical protein
MLIEIIFKNLAHTSKKTTLLHYKDQLVNIIMEIISVYTENHTKTINTKCSITDS